MHSVAMISQKFNSPEDEHRNKNHLLTFNIDMFLKGTAELPDALVNLQRGKYRFFPQVPIPFQCEDRKISILKYSIIGKPRAMRPI